MLLKHHSPEWGQEGREKRRDCVSATLRIRRRVTGMAGQVFCPDLHLAHLQPQDPCYLYDPISSSDKQK